MDQLRAMRVLMRVAERGSLTAASADLGYARGGASAILSDLERYLGVQLVERTTRSLRLTEDGEVYLERARAILAQVEALEDEIGSGERQPRGLLRVQAPAGLTRLVLAPSLPRFLADYPQMRIEVLSRNGMPDFVADRIDAAVIVGPVPELGVVARTVGQIPYLTVAAPAYLARQGTPQTALDLKQHDCIPILSSLNGHPVNLRFRHGGKDLQIAPEGPLAFETAEAAVAAAVRGAGILQLASYLVFDEVRSGKLVPILDKARPPSETVRLVYQKHRLKPRKLRVFEEFLRDLNLRTRQKWGVQAV